MINYKIHPLAETFPPFTTSEFDALVSDISAHGQREPITLFEGKVLDGVHRLKACRQLNMEPRVRNYGGKDPLGFSVSENLKRRHLNESQRSMLAAKLLAAQDGKSPIKSGVPATDRANLHTESRTSVAEKLNVSTRSVATAKQVLKDAPTKDIKAIESGKKTVSAVAKQIKESKTDKEKLADKVGRVVPGEMVSEWERATQIGRKLQSLAREIKSIVSEGFSGAKQDRVKDSIYAEINNSVVSDAEALAWSVSSVIPYALCPTCQGFNRETCGLCKKRGWISKFLWNSPAVSEDTKRIITGK